MANVKITELTAYTNPDTTDVLPIVDVGADVTKKVSIENLLKNASSGTAAAPGIAFDGGNTGIYSPGADQVAISTNGTGRLFVDGSGNVGLGTSSPLSTLHVVGSSSTSNTGATVLVDSDAALAVDIGGSIAFRGTDGGSQRTYGLVRGGKATSGVGAFDGYLAFETRLNGQADTTERVRITNTGNVGVGTTSPGNELEVNGTAQAITLQGYDCVQGAGSLSLRALGSGANNGFLQNDYTEINFNNRRTSDGSSGTVARIRSIAEADQTSSWPTSLGFYVRRFGSGFQAFRIESTGAAVFQSSSTEFARIDSSGRLLVGTSSTPVAIESITPRLVSSTDGSLNGDVAIYSYRNAGGSGRQTIAPRLFFARSRSDTNGTIGGIVAANEDIGNIRFAADDGTQFLTAAEILAEVDGTPGVDDMPGRLVFSVTADGASSPTERMRIDSAGFISFAGDTDTGIKYIGTNSFGFYTTNQERITIGATGNVGINNTNPTATLDVDGPSYFARDANTVATFNRNTDDGIIIILRQDDVTEGSISVSGNTVSYNGAHLSRWSQLSGGAERTEILRGTVLSNIDEMCEWGDEDNEQLNRMKVSDVEGDKNVSGVFQAWDDDDDIYTNDFYCAMTGDFIIRIAAGVTVERGDLLMSAGDGTAKPQDDDIIRSKTIAKVTSTTVSCTYDDGSYCVPCVLMAC